MAHQEQDPRIERLEKAQQELQNQFAQSQQELALSRQELAQSRQEAKDQFTVLMNAITTLAKGKAPATVETEDIAQGSFLNEEALPNTRNNEPNPEQNRHDSVPGRTPEKPIIPDYDDHAERLYEGLQKTQETSEVLEKQNKMLEERLLAIERGNFSNVYDLKELSLVPDLVLPPKFRMPEFDKFDGTSCPNSHLRMFCRAMTGYGDDDELFIHCFQASLAGSAKRWYNQLSRAEAKSWRHLAQAFTDQYKHVTDMTPDRMSLMAMEKRSNESFRQYAQKWRDVATQVQPPLTNKEMTVWFVNTLRAPYYDKLVGSATKDFADLVISGELIENAVKCGRLETPEANARKTSASRKHEGEAHMVEGKQARQPYYTPQASFGNANVQPPKNEARKPQPRREPAKFDPIPMSYGELFPKLVASHLAATKFLPPTQPKNGVYPKGYNGDEKCEYHGGNPGHNIENCFDLKYLVQGLINAKVLKFDDP